MLGSHVLVTLHVLFTNNIELKEEEDEELQSLGTGVNMVFVRKTFVATS